MKILIGTDGSEFSKMAVKECCRLFPFADKIMIVSAFEEQYAMVAEPFGISAPYYQQMADAAKAQARLFADSAADIIRREFSDNTPEISTEVVNDPPEKAIVDLAREWGADVIVVGSHGRGFWGRMIGSVSDGVVHHAPCSVLVVRTPQG